MSPSLTDRTHRLLSLSLPLVQSHRAEIVDRMQESLALAEPGLDHDAARARAAALVTLLIDQVRKLLDGGRLGDLGAIAGEHAALEIGGRTYSRFGDMIVPILRDVLGVNLPNGVAGAWCDAFWMVIQEATAQPMLEVA